MLVTPSCDCGPPLFKHVPRSMPLTLPSIYFLCLTTAFLQTHHHIIVIVFYDDLTRCVCVCVGVCACFCVCVCVCVCMCVCVYIRDGNELFCPPATVAGRLKNLPATHLFYQPLFIRYIFF